MLYQKKNLIKLFEKLQNILEDEKIYSSAFKTAVADIDVRAGKEIKSYLNILTKCLEPLDNQAVIAFEFNVAPYDLEFEKQKHKFQAKTKNLNLN